MRKGYNMKSSTKPDTVGFRTILRQFDWQKYIVYVAFVVVFIFFAVVLRERGFSTLPNVLNIARQTAMISIMAVAMTFVIATGQIDLSVGSTTAVAALVTALTVNATGSILVSLIVGLGVGTIVGGTNGLIITRLRIPSFLVTLGMMSIARGFAMWITNTAAVPILSPGFNFIFGSGDILGVPILLFWTIVIGAIGHYTLNHTPYGKRVLATGGNEQAATYTGVNTRNIKLLVITISGIAASLAGILYAGRMQAGRFTFGEGDELSVIAAVIIGGTSLSGGAGSVVGAIMGSLLMGVINNGLIIAGLTVSQQMIIRGIIIILAVAVGKKAER